MRFSKDLKCVRHCDKTIFTYDSFATCPLCGATLGEHLDNTPVSSFQNTNNLHIGLTSSLGTIVEFDVNGLIRTPPKAVVAEDEWNQCLIIAQVPESWYDRWDEVLEQVSQEQNWTKDTYHGDSHNCYTFVLNFLTALEYGEFFDLCHDKLSFTEKIIASKTQIAAKYITIHRKLQSCSYFIEEQA
uniref:MKRN2 opposite strand protein-like C-terminal domain-containing protein n=1 Tax=Anopheles dirus TaxID=7168 RepID=A0A182NXB7_9DIPT